MTHRPIINFLNLLCCTLILVGAFSCSADPQQPVASSPVVAAIPLDSGLIRTPEPAAKQAEKTASESWIEDQSVEKFKAYGKVAKIPKYIMAYADSIVGDFTLANPGEVWNPGCLREQRRVTKSIRDPKTGKETVSFTGDPIPLPNYQLIYFGLGKHLALLTFQAGGIGTHNEVLIMRHHKGKVVQHDRHSTLANVSTPSEILAAVCP